MRRTMSATLLCLIAVLGTAVAQSAPELNPAAQPAASGAWQPQRSPAQLQNGSAQPLASAILRRRWSPHPVQNATAQPVVGAALRTRWLPAHQQGQAERPLDSAAATLLWPPGRAQALVSLSSRTGPPAAPVHGPVVQSPVVQSPVVQGPVVQPLDSAASGRHRPAAGNESGQILVGVNSRPGWSPEATGRSYHTLPDDVLDNDVDSRKSPAAVGTAEYTPLTYSQDHYSSYPGKYQPQEGGYKKVPVSRKQPAGGYKYGAKKQKGAAGDDYPTGPSPRDRLGFEDDEDYEDHEGGYGYGYVEDDGYYEHGSDYRPHPAYRGPPVYAPHRHHHHGDKYLKFGILALLKLILAKLKAFGLFKLLLLLIVKPILLFKLALKFLFITKAFNALTLAPLLLAPLLLLPLLLVPLLFPLAPLLLLPLLLPLLLLLLPVPVLTPGAGGTNGRRRRRAAADAAADSAGPGLLMLTRRVLEADQCLERVACQLAARRSSLYNRFVIWLVERFQQWAAPRPRLASYLGAYRQGAEVPGQCRARYPCDGAALALPEGSLLHQLL